MVKYDKAKVKRIYEETKSKGYAAFTDRINKELKMPKSSARAVFYTLKKADTSQTTAPQQTEAPVEPTENAVENTKNITVVDTSSVHVEQAPSLEEGSTLRDKYKNMYEEISVQPQSEKPADVSSSETPEVSVGGIGTTPAQSYKLKLGELFYQVGIAVNNNLLWNERPLHEEEKTFIHDTSNDLEATFNPEDLESEQAPWYNYGLATLLLPVLSRVDLIPKKIDAVRHWFTGRKPFEPVAPMTNSTVAEHQTVEPQEINGVNAAVWNNLSAQQQVWVNDIVSKGYRVSPNYNPNGLLDDVAYRDIHVLRNKGDNWGSY